VGLILRSAVELEDKAIAPAEATRGMSLAELENVAREAGIDPRHIHRAVAALDSKRDKTTPGSFVGSPTRIVIERQVDGEISSDHFDALIDTIRQRTGNFGKTETVGRSLSWTTRRTSSFVAITVVPRDGKTTIRVVYHLWEVALAIFMGSLITGGLLAIPFAVATVAAGAALPLGLGVSAATLGGAYAFARGLFRRGLRSNSTEAQ
jgi:hypothetical protein